MPKVMLHNKYQPIKESWSTKVFHFSPSIICLLSSMARRVVR